MPIGTAIPGCLVVDMDLPEGGAVGLLRMLASSQVILPAIITSRRLRRQTPHGGLPPGRILFLDKPFGIDELSAAHPERAGHDLRQPTRVMSAAYGVLRR